MDINTRPTEIKNESTDVSNDFDANKLVGVENKFENNQTNESFDTNRLVENNAENKEHIDNDVKPERYIECKNASLKDDVHPITGVPFVEKTITKSDGEKITGVFSQFESLYDAKLPKELYTETDKKQFAECNKQLKENLEKDPSLKEKFDEEQLDQIENGETPDGYVWHHNEEEGKMQLVDFETHQKTGHTGGKCVWGEGNR